MSYKSQDYEVRIFFSAEDEGFIAQVLDMKGVSAFGDTREEAAREIDVALRLALQTYEDDGVEPPAPGSGMVEVITGRRTKSDKKRVYIEAVPSARHEGGFTVIATAAGKPRAGRVFTTQAAAIDHARGVKPKNPRPAAFVK